MIEEAQKKNSHKKIFPTQIYRRSNTRGKQRMITGVKSKYLLL